MPRDYVLRANYPNPFNPSTTISYDLPTATSVQIEIFNISGQKVRGLMSGVESAGRHSVVWDGCDDVGTRVASGVYLYRMSADDFAQTRKMMLLK